MIEVYFNDETSVSYASEFDEEGNLIKFIDCTQDDNPIEYAYEYNENSMVIARKMIFK